MNAPIAPPPTPAAAPAADAPVTPSLPRRLACWLYEGMLLFGVVFLAGYLFSTLTQTRHAMDNRLAQQVFLFLVFGLYFSWFWSKGQTLAMRTWYIRVVDREGQNISQWRALRRYVFCWIWFLPPLAAGNHLQISGVALLVVMMAWVWLWALLARFHPERQFWHDAWAGTRLVHHQPPEPTKSKKKAATEP